MNSRHIGEVMDSRKHVLVTCIVRHYIKSAQPVASLALVKKYHLGYSPATVRSELALLEDSGYMYQPYTSSGRIPTDRAYELYVESVKPVPLNRTQLSTIQGAWQVAHSRLFDRLKTLARALASETRELVFFSLCDGETYCTGFSYLCDKPEFEDRRFAAVISQVVDRIDELVFQLSREATDVPQVRIGRKNVFSNLVSTMFVRFMSSRQKGILGLVGPMRMDYEKNISLLSKSKEIIEN